MNTLLTIKKVLQHPNCFRGWLYLRDMSLSLNSEGFFYTADLALSPEEEKLVRDGFTKEGWRPTLSADDVEDVVCNLEEQLGVKATVDQKFEAFNYFYSNDAFIEWPFMEDD